MKISRDSDKLVRLTATGLYDFDQFEVKVEECHGLIGVDKEPGGAVEFSLREIEGIEDEANRRTSGCRCTSSSSPRNGIRITGSQ